MAYKRPVAMWCLAWGKEQCPLFLAFPALECPINYSCSFPPLLWKRGPRKELQCSLGTYTCLVVTVWAPNASLQGGLGR